jgi:chemotaxis protein CheC
MSDATSLTDLEKDALQEIMNIGFGRAAADLAEILGIHVILSIPQIKLMETSDVVKYIHHEIPDTNDMSMITQFFSGKLNGVSYLVIPQGEGLKLLHLFDEDATGLDQEYDLATLQRETLLEIGNIIIGACVGKLAEMLNDSVSYAPPRYFAHEMIYDSLTEGLSGDKSFALLFKTIFSFEKEDVNGFLFLVSNPAVMAWLKNSIENYLKQYE